MPETPALLALAWLATFGLAHGGWTAQASDSGPTAVQAVHRESVPHTDIHGAPLRVWDSERSFFPIGVWGVPESRVHGEVDHRWSQLAAAGFNTVWPWPAGGYLSSEMLAQAHGHGLRVVLMRRPGPEDVQALMRDHSSLLGIVWQDEPILQPGYSPETIEDFLAYRDSVRAVAPHLPVFVNCSAWIDHPDWPRWIAAGDVACHDNYPVWPVTQSINLGSFGTSTNGVADSVAAAVRESGGQRPIWLVVGAFESLESPLSQFPFRFPTPAQLRAIVYAGIIHGATGICYFTWDSHISRAGNIVGFSPDPVARPHLSDPPANPTQMIVSRALWSMASQINTELGVLTPSLLSLTVSGEVSLALTVEGESVTPHPIRALLKRDPTGDLTLLTVNMDNAVLSAVFEFDRALESVTPLFENRGALNLDDGARDFGEVFEPFGVHAYRIRVERSAPGNP